MKDQQKATLMKKNMYMYITFISENRKIMKENREKDKLQRGKRRREKAKTEATKDKSNTNLQDRRY